jgi:hypothetical protein
MTLKASLERLGALRALRVMTCAPEVRRGGRR